jgi:hypothetical protein
MASARSRCVDEAVTPWYHCISRCVRRLSLCGGQFVRRKQWIQDRLQQLVEKTRKRLANLGWFMKCLKEPLARRANREDGSTGAFWEGRYKSIAVLDETILLATAAYIDLNPLFAGVAPTPEDSRHTSLRIRLDHCQATGTEQSLLDQLSTLTHNPAQEVGCGCCHWPMIGRKVATAPD